MNDEIKKLTFSAIEELQNGQQSIQSIVDEHFDLWEYELAPVLRRRWMSVYKEVAKIIRRAGVVSADEKNVGACFRRIRKAREVSNV
jgi:hypothetical protein